jgi:hypothetical protein
MQNHLKNIKQAIINNADLEAPLNNVLNSITSSAQLDLFIDAVYKKAIKNSRYLKVFDFLHEKYPKNPYIPFSKAQIYHHSNRREAIKILIQTLSILHQTDDDHLLIRLSYETLGVHFQKLNQPEQAIAACKIAKSYY